MADYDLPAVMQALQAADAAGNTEDARQLADIAHSLSSAPQSPANQAQTTTAGGSALPPGVPTPDPQADASYYSEFGKGLVSGLTPLASMATSGVRKLISPFVSEQTLKDYDQSTQETADFNKKNYGGPAAVPSVGDIHNLRGAGLYAASTLGSAAPVIGATVIGGPWTGAAVGAAQGGKEAYDQTEGDPLATAAGAAIGGGTALIRVPFLKGAGEGFSTGLKAFTEPGVQTAVDAVTKAPLQVGGSAVKGAIGGALAGAAGGALSNVPEAVYTGNPADAIPSLSQVGEGAARGAVLGGAAGGLMSALPEEVSLLPRGSADEATRAEVSADEAAKGRLAQRIQSEADNSGVTLGKDVKYGAPKGDEAILENVHNGIAEDIKTLSKTLKEQLSPDLAEDVDDLFNRSTLQSTLRDARNKVKGTASESDIRSLNEAVGHTQEGAALVDLVRQSNHLTDLFRGGMKGGISPYTDFLSPFTRGGSERAGGSGFPSMIQNAELVHAVMHPPTGLPALAAGTGAALAGRAIDATFGLKSNVKRFVNSNIDKAVPLDFGDKPSIIAQRNADAQTQASLADPEAARLAQRERDLYFQKFADNNPGAGGFLRSLWDQTGLLPQDASTGVKELHRIGTLTKGEEDAFHSSPRDLMQNNVGNHIIDLLDGMARKDKLQRDPVWIAKQQGGQQEPVGSATSTSIPEPTSTPAPTSTVPPPPMPNQTGGIRNPAAYQAQAAGNQARITQAQDRIASSPHSSATREAISGAAAAIGRTNNRTEATAVHNRVVEALKHDPEAQAYAAQQLTPLVRQIRHATPEDVEKAREGRPLTPMQKIDVAQKAENLVKNPSHETLIAAFADDAPIFARMLNRHENKTTAPDRAMLDTLTEFEHWVRSGRPDNY